jgi:16S rRNA processing protein RimM
MLVELEGVTDCNQAEKLKGLKIWVPNDVVEIEDDEYLWQDLIGCDVVLEGTGDVLGTVTALEEYGAQDILNVCTAEDAEIQGEWMIPFIEDVIVEVNLEEARITVNLPEGMDACFTPRF